MHHKSSISLSLFVSLMKTMRAKFLKVFLNKWQKMGSRVIPSAAGCDCCGQWALWPSKQEDKCIPSDVPKGHLVVYVGEDYTRYVINITLLKHPLFKVLLDEAQEEYDFTAASKLCIPCDENIFLSVVRCAASPQDRGISFCLWLVIHGEVSIKFILQCFYPKLGNYMCSLDLLYNCLIPVRLLSMCFNPKIRNANSNYFLSMLLASNLCRSPVLICLMSYLGLWFWSTERGFAPFY